jgi:hypothetical protein
MGMNLDLDMVKGIGKGHGHGHRHRHGHGTIHHMDMAMEAGMDIDIGIVSKYFMLLISHYYTNEKHLQNILIFGKYKKYRYIQMMCIYPTAGCRVPGFGNHDTYARQLIEATFLVHSHTILSI